jgi:hypothetical protein
MLTRCQLPLLLSFVDAHERGDFYRASFLPPFRQRSLPMTPYHASPRLNTRMPIRPILTTHIFFPLFFFLSLILPFSCLRFFSDLTANVTFFNFL